jgi:hypothetical protein
MATVEPHALAETRERAQTHIEEERKTRAENIAAAEQRYGRPTPTQEENDMAALGHPIIPRSDDGSGPDPRIHRPHGGPQTTHTRHMEAQHPSAAYKTRQQTSQSSPAKGE